MIQNLIVNFKLSGSADIPLTMMIQDAASGFSTDTCRCSVCGDSAGFYTCSDGYSRYVVDWCNGERVTAVVEIRCFVCKACRHKHALLSNVLIPYEPYSVRFIFQILYDYYQRTETTTKICERYGVSISMLHRWANRFRRDAAAFWGSSITSVNAAFCAAFMECLVSETTFCVFSCSFLFVEGRPFLSGMMELPAPGNSCGASEVSSVTTSEQSLCFRMNTDTVELLQQVCHSCGGRSYACPIHESPPFRTNS